MTFKFTDLKLSQSLVDAAAKIVVDSKKKVAEQVAAEAPVYNKMRDPLRPLTPDAMDYTINPTIAAAQRLNSAITEIHNATVKQREAEQANHAALVQRTYAKMGGVTPITEGMHVMPQNNDKADSRHNAVMAHAKKMGYNVHHEEHYGDEKSGNKGSPDITIHYQRGDDRKSASPEAIEIHRSGKASRDNVLKSYAAGKVAPIAEAELSLKQKKIASIAGDKTKIDVFDLATLRNRKSKISQDVAENKSDNTPFNWKLYKSSIPSKPGEKAGFDSKKISTGTVYSRKWTKDKNPNGEVKSESVEENTDTPGNSYEHQCAIHVKNESFGVGRTITTQHADPDADGNIAWYDVMFEHGIEKRVPITELEVLEAMSHGNHPKKKKKA